MDSIVGLLQSFVSTTISFNGTSLAVTWGDLILGFALPVTAIYALIRFVVYFVKQLPPT